MSNLLLDSILTTVSAIYKFAILHFLLLPILIELRSSDSQKLSAEVVLIDFPGQNPYRDLMALVGTSPLLLKTIVAVSARDFANFNNNSSSLLDWSALPLESSNKLQSTSRYHALSYKQSALAQLRNDLEKTSGVNHHVLFAAISLLIFIEVLESGKDAWRVHLEGAKQLIQMKEISSQGNELVTHNPSPSPHTNSFFFDACIAYVHIPVPGLLLAANENTE
jgi:hypothetical protein